MVKSNSTKKDAFMQSLRIMGDSWEDKTPTFQQLFNLLAFLRLPMSGAGGSGADSQDRVFCRPCDLPLCNQEGILAALLPLI